MSGNISLHTVTSIHVAYAEQEALGACITILTLGSFQMPVWSHSWPWKCQLAGWQLQPPGAGDRRHLAGSAFIRLGLLPLSSAFGQGKGWPSCAASSSSVCTCPWARSLQASFTKCPEMTGEPAHTLLNLPYILLLPAQDDGAQRAYNQWRQGCCEAQESLGANGAGKMGCVLCRWTVHITQTTSRRSGRTRWRRCGKRCGATAVPAWKRTVSSALTTCGVW